MGKSFNWNMGGGFVKYMGNDVIKMTTKKFLFFLMAIIFVILMCIGLFYAINNEIAKAKEDLKICKSLGYDGFKYPKGFPAKRECSNFTPLEKEKRRIAEENKK